MNYSDLLNYAPVKFEIHYRLIIIFKIKILLFFSYEIRTIVKSVQITNDKNI